ncbi:18372_t:CDS:2, partial [Funneliformis geosporum]
FIPPYFWYANFVESINWRNAQCIVWEAACQYDTNNFRYFEDCDISVENKIKCGNILQDGITSYISDFGLTGPADKQKSDNRIYGVLPYIAPEVLNGETYTFASDIYSFGVIMAEYSSGNPPFYNRKHDVSLTLDVCNGLRPEFGKRTPEFYKKLAYRCMNANPNQRPSSDELRDDKWKGPFQNNGDACWHFHGNEMIGVLFQQTFYLFD